MSERKISFNLLRLSGLCGILGSILPLFMVLAASMFSSWFSWETNALSELGLGDQSILFNSAVLIGGILNLFFAFGLQEYFNGEKLVKVGASSVIMSSVFLALSGIFTIENHFAHGFVALGYFVLAPVGFILIGFGTKNHEIKKLSIPVGISALVAILVLPILFFVLPFQVGFAVPELVEALLISVWTIFISAKLINFRN